MSQDKADHEPNLDQMADELARPRPQLGFVGFLVAVIAAATVGTVGLVVFNQQSRVADQVSETMAEAKRMTRRFDLASLREAEALLEGLLELDRENPAARASLALVNVAMMQHGIDRMSEAEQQHQKATEAGARSPTWYAVGAYLDIARGHPDKANRDMTTLLEDGRYDPMIAHALGWAKIEQGQYIEGNRDLRTAIEGQDYPIFYRLTLAEYAHRQGDLAAAIESLEYTYSANANPRLLLAKAWCAALRLRVLGSLTRPLDLLDEVRQNEDKVGPRTKGLLIWAEGELALATGDALRAIEKADQAAENLKGYPPLLDLKARATEALAKPREAVALYEQALSAKPEYRGTRWALARLKSKLRDDDALTLIDQLEKSVEGEKGPEFEIFRGEHSLRKGDLDEAEARFTAAAALGDNPDAYLGLARVAFARESPKGQNAEIEKVASYIETALSKRRYYPEAHEYAGDVLLWNLSVRRAHAKYKTAEQEYKKLKRPVIEMVAFYNRVVAAYRGVEARGIKREALKMARVWEGKKREFLESLLSS